MLLMDKAVLVLDKMPESCSECPLHAHRFKDETYCTITRNTICEFWESYDRDERPEWCPLQYPYVYDDAEKYEKDLYKGGWNDAMEQIGVLEDWQKDFYS